MVSPVFPQLQVSVSPSQGPGRVFLGAILPRVGNASFSAHPGRENQWSAIAFGGALLQRFWADAQYWHRERERERDREETQRERQRQRHRDRGRDRDGQQQTETDRQKQRERERDTDLSSRRSTFFAT